MGWGMSKIEAVKGISFAVEQGQVVTLIGTNGAGKTTTLRAISGLLRPSAGRISFEGKPIHNVPAHQIVKIAQYAKWAAADMRAKGRRGSVTAMLTRPMWRFVRDYFVLSGWRDGRAGFIKSLGLHEARPEVEGQNHRHPGGLAHWHQRQTVVRPMQGGHSGCRYPRHGQQGPVAARNAAPVALPRVRLRQRRQRSMPGLS